MDCIDSPLRVLVELGHAEQSFQSGMVARRVKLAAGRVVLESAPASMALTLSDEELTTIHDPRWRPLMIGAGQLSQFLTRIAAAMDYDVTVCDPREDYREGWDVEGVESWQCDARRHRA